MLGGASITFFLIVDSENESNRLLSGVKTIQMKAENESVQAARRGNESKYNLQRIQLELESVKRSLDPFKKLAYLRYPEESPDSALFKLANDLRHLQERTSKLEVKTSNVATQDAFRPLAEPYRSQVLSNLSQVRISSKERIQKVRLWSDVGNLSRQQVTGEIADFMKHAGINVERPQSGMTIANGSLPPLRIKLHPEDLALANSLSNALSPLIKVKFTGEYDDKLSRGEFEIRIHGQPVFNQDGTLVIR